MYKILYLFLALAVSSVTSFAQIVNKGGLYVSSNALFSTYYPFENKIAADFRNNGVFYIYNDLINNGAFFDYKGSTPQGTIIFKSDRKQAISGSSVSKFNTLVFDNATEDIAFDLRNEIVVESEMEFLDGIARVDDQLGSVTFLKNAEIKEVGHHSYLEGTIEKEGNSEFVFPIGDKGYNRLAMISAPKNEKDVFSGKYSLDDSSFFESHSNKSGVLDLINNREYWVIERKATTQSDVILTLSWDERTTPKELLNNPEKELRIVRWDEQQRLWIDEGGIVDVENKTIVTPANVSGYGFFTLGAVKTDWLLENDIVIYNYVSANGDGKNDYFKIVNITNFPNNKVEIFNRWGVRVFETTNYNATGNVFRGYTGGRVNVKKNDRLASGTYYYVFSYEYVNERGVQVFKKSGYLHLDND